ncbi:MAG: triple tyrosine motif-containing protein [Flavobacteriales bacterium]|nr:triple tyrosine motif-containing protein [Flavobacteriales bacterium]
MNTNYSAEPKIKSLAEFGISSVIISSFDYDASHLVMQTFDAKFYLLDLETFSCTAVQFKFEEDTQSFGDAAVALFHRDNDIIWVSVVPFGIFRENLRTGETQMWAPNQDAPFNIPAGHINSISTQNDDVLIALGGGRGIFKLNKETDQFQPMLVPGKQDSGISFPDANAICMLRHVDNKLYLAMEGKGLYVFEGNKLQRYNHFNGLMTESILDMVAVNDSTLVFFTPQGLIAVTTTKMKFTEVHRQEVSYNTFLKEGGISPGASNHVLYFYKNYLYDFDFGSVNEYKQYSKPVIGAFHVFDTPLFSDVVPKVITLNYNQNFFTIWLTAFNFSKSGTTEISYKLEGFDPDWSLVGAVNDVAYTNVSAGEYQFRIRSRKPGDEWSEPVVYSIIIHPPFWETWWFRILVVLAIAAIFYGVYRCRLAQILKLQSVRNKIASDLHDDMGATLSSINIYSKLALDNIENNTTNSRDMLTRIKSSTIEMMDSMSDIVWSINPGNDSLQSLVQRINAHAAEVLGGMGIMVENQNEIQHDSPLSMTARKNIYLIAKEAINNIAKHSEASEVNLKFATSGKYFEMKIEDDGKGEKIESLKLGNGLRSMKARAKELGGNLELYFDPGTGTTVEMNLPLNEIS